MNLKLWKRQWEPAPLSFPQSYGITEITKKRKLWKSMTNTLKTKRKENSIIVAKRKVAIFKY